MADYDEIQQILTLCYHLLAAANCPNPGPLVNGHMTPSSSVFAPGARVAFSCNNGFMLQGSASLTCQSGRWQGAVPVCKG